MGASRRLLPPRRFEHGRHGLRHHLPIPSAGSWGAHTLPAPGRALAVLLLREALLRRFKERLHIPDDPIIATARGLFRYALMARQRADHG